MVHQQYLIKFKNTKIRNPHLQWGYLFYVFLRLILKDELAQNLLHVDFLNSINNSNNNKLFSNLTCFYGTDGVVYLYETKIGNVALRLGTA